MKIMKNVATIITPNAISITSYVDQEFKQTTINKNDEKFKKVLEFIKSDNEEGLLELIYGRLNKFTTYIKGNFKLLKDGRILHEETETFISKFLSNRIVEWDELGLPIKPLINFHLKVIKNPNPESIEDLYEFLEKNKIGITEDGSFIAYKKVTTVNGKLMDSHTRTISNEVGNIVKMPREKCDPNRNSSCSTGLHVGAFEYVSKFTGDTVILCLVSPENVVAVPKDYSAQKMRCCEYEVIGIFGAKNELNVNYVKKVVNIDDENYTDEVEEDVAKEPIINESIAPSEKETKSNTSSSINLPDYDSLTGPEWVEWAAKNLGLIITTGLAKKDRIYKKILKELEK